MNIQKFPNPKLNLPKEFKNSTASSLLTSFSAVSKYLYSVGEYIYSDINLNYQLTDSMHIHAWIQKITSAIILRSLYIRNAFVESFNCRNIVGIYMPLKAWLETAGALACILDLLERNLPPDELFKEFEPFALGNRGKGSFRIGKVDSRNVQTMIEKGDKYLKKLIEKSSREVSSFDDNSFFTDYYDVASNPTHPSFDAFEMMGGIKDGGIWKANSPDEVRHHIIEYSQQYGGLLMAPIFVKNLCQKIFEIEKEHFIALGSRGYFEARD